jgi:hypothetical protein
MPFNIYMGSVAPEGLPGMLYDQQREDYLQRRDLALQEAELRVQEMNLRAAESQQSKWMTVENGLAEIGPDGTFRGFTENPYAERRIASTPRYQFLNSGTGVFVGNPVTGEGRWEASPRQNKTERFAADGKLWERDPFTGEVAPVEYNGQQLTAPVGRSASGGTGTGGGGVTNDNRDFDLMTKIGGWYAPVTPPWTTEQQDFRNQMEPRINEMRDRLAGPAELMGLPTSVHRAKLPALPPANWNQPGVVSDGVSLNSPQVALMLALTGTGSGTAPGSTGGKPLTREAAQYFKEKAGGNRALAEQMARQEGYTF